jgi:hypothetical protein
LVIGDFRQKAGMLEGNLPAVITPRDVAVKKLVDIQTRLADATAQMSLLRTNAEN